MGEAEAGAHLTWNKGGTASFVTVAGDLVTLRSSIPSPPGATGRPKTAPNDRSNPAWCGSASTPAANGEPCSSDTGG